MKMKIEFDMDNAAFEENGDYEIVAVLNRVAERYCSDGWRDGKVLDSNGNSVGEWKVTGR